MKVFKEKKTSLLYLLRRGLVVLSILALAFALAGCGNGNNGNGNDLPPPPPPPPPGPGPEPTAPYVRVLRLLNDDLYRAQASGTDWNLGFQGFAPSLEGALLQLEWSDGRNETVMLGASHPEFYTIPPAPNFAGWRPGTQFWIRHSSMPSGARSSNTFTMDRVVRLDSFGLSFPPGQVWFADQRPDQMEGFHAAGTWRWLATLTDNGVGTHPRWNYEYVTSDIVTAAGASFTDMGYFNAAVALGETMNFAGLGTRRVVTDDDDLVWLLEEFSQGIPFSIDYPELDFTHAPQDGRIRALIGSNDPRAAGNEYINERAAVITVARFLHVANVSLESADDFVFFDDQFRDAIRVLPTDATQRPFARDDIRTEIFRMLDTNNATFRIHYDDGVTSRVIDWPTFQANRAWWDSVVLPGQQWTRNRLFVSSGNLVEDHQNNWMNGLLDDQGTGFWGPTLAYVGRSFTGVGIAGGADDYVLFTPLRPVYGFTGFPENAISRRFGPGSSNPAFHQMLPDGLVTAFGELTALVQGGILSTPYAHMVDGRPRSIRQISGLLDDINTHYRLVGTYSPLNGTGAPRTRDMTFVSGMFDRVNADGLVYEFLAWPAHNWAIPGEEPTLTNWGLDVQWRGSTVTGAPNGVLVNVVAHQNLLAPDPVLNVQFRLPDFSFGDPLPNIAAFRGMTLTPTAATVSDAFNQAAVVPLAWAQFDNMTIRGFPHAFTLRLLASTTDGAIFSNAVIVTPLAPLNATGTDYAFSAQTVTPAPARPGATPPLAAGREIVVGLTVTAREVVESLALDLNMGAVTVGDYLPAFASVSDFDLTSVGGAGTADLSNVATITNIVWARPSPAGLPATAPPATSHATATDGIHAAFVTFELLGPLNNQFMFSTQPRVQTVEGTNVSMTPTPLAQNVHGTMPAHRRTMVIRFLFQAQP